MSFNRILVRFTFILTPSAVRPKSVVVNEEEKKGGFNGNRDGYQSAGGWKIRNCAFCIGRIGNLPEFCSDFHGNHFRYRERHFGGTDPGSEYHGQAY